MLLVSVPHHNKKLDLDDYYYVYDSDDGKTDRILGYDILRYAEAREPFIHGVVPSHTGCLYSYKEGLDDGDYLAVDKNGNKRCIFSIKDGYTAAKCDFMLDENIGVRDNKIVRLSNEEVRDLVKSLQFHGIFL